MKQRIPWLRVFAEGAVIVVSILLAFGIDAWWEGRQERAEEAEILQGLRGDFEANQTQLASAIRVHRLLVTRLGRLDRMSPAEISALPVDSAAAYGSAMEGSRTFDVQDGTLDAVIASGKLDLVGDASLRAALVGWKRMIEDATEEAREFRGATDRVLSRIGSLGGPWLAEPETFFQDAPTVIPLASELPLPDFDAVARDEALHDLLRVKRYYSLLYLLALVPLSDHAAEVAEMLEATAP